MGDDSFQPVEGLIVFPSQDPISAPRLPNVEFFERKLKERQHLKVLSGLIAERFVERLASPWFSVEAQSGNLSRLPDDLANLDESWRGQMVGSCALGKFQEGWIFGEAVIEIASQSCKNDRKLRTRARRSFPQRQHGWLAKGRL
jgi:hypothetical protein